MKANLHIHTTNSDGTKTVSEINQLAQQFGFDLVAITDHDTVEAIDEINADASKPLPTGDDFSTSCTDCCNELYEL